ncbi:MAG: glutathione S-transferase C-terminal domain-containing protein [Oscillospiraceae bacterium]|nr:glutathione S-transferase C-terminal domain-containing protein [Oscillospiraceae bacterium]
MNYRSEEQWERGEKIDIGNIAVTVNKNEISHGSFVRQRPRFDTPFGTGENENPVEAHRYRLIWTPGCPWSHRQMITIRLLGLEKVISIGKVAVNKSKNGWVFELNADGKDPVLKVSCLPELYLRSDPSYGGRATVPVLVDLKTGKIANNDFHHLSNYFQTAWKPLHKKNAPDLYPEELRSEIDELNAVIYNDINNGVYRAGFSQNQRAYEMSYRTVFRRLGMLEEHLSKNRFLFGDRITDSDIRLYTTLARFDIAYVYNFYLNGKRIRDHHNLWNYMKELFSIRAFRETTDFDTIKQGYMLRVPEENPYGILPLGPDLSVWYEPNDRSSIFGELDHDYN